MHADEGPCAIATRALPGASSTRRRGVEGRGGTRRHGACGGRSLSREQREGQASCLMAGELVTEYVNSAIRFDEISLVVVKDNRGFLRHHINCLGTMD